MFKICYNIAGVILGGSGLQDTLGYAQQFAARYLDVNDVRFCDSENPVAMLLGALNFSHGDEILVCANLQSDISAVIAKCGAKAVLCDIKEDTLNADMSELLSKLTEHTRAAVIPHAFGEMAEIERVSKELCEQNVIVIEECINLLGAVRFGRRVIYRPASHGFGCVFEPDFAFVSSKTGPLPDIFENGGAREAAENFLRAQPEFETRNGQRRLAASRYEKLIFELGLLPFVKPKKLAEGSFVTCPLYPLRVQERDRLFAYLESRNIPCRIPQFAFENTCCPNFERAKRELLLLPTKDISFEQQQNIMNEIRNFYGK